MGRSGLQPRHLWIRGPGSAQREKRAPQVLGLGSPGPRPLLSRQFSPGLPQGGLRLPAVLQPEALPPSFFLPSLQSPADLCQGKGSLLEEGTLERCLPG